MFKKFGEFYKIDNGGVPVKAQKAESVPQPHVEIDTVKSPFSQNAYREFLTRHRNLSAKIDFVNKNEKS